MRPFKQRRAIVIGSGPNGLSAAVVLAQSGVKVDVYEAEAIPGGGCRTLELTLPGFLHDFGSAVHPLAVGSPFFQSLPLEKYGLEWIYSPAPLAHPFADGSAVLLQRELAQQAEQLGSDGAAWRRLFAPLAENWNTLRDAILQPLTPFSASLWRHPLLMTRFGLPALMPARLLARRLFKDERARGLFAGLAAHSFLSLDAPLSASFGLVLGTAAHAVGWPIPRGGSQSITQALVAHLESLGGELHLGHRVERLRDLAPADVTLCDITPRQLLILAAERLNPSYRRSMRLYRYGPAAFKVDYALNAPLPWKAKECLQAATVHVGGSLDAIAESERAMSRGRVAEEPLLLVAQPSLFDPTRVPTPASGQPSSHTAWVYCQVPNGYARDVLPRIEEQLERYAPGFRDCMLARNVLTPAGLEAMDANLVGGDISGGASDGAQFLLRPTGQFYKTPAPDLFLCSSSTPPGGGVHGMCGHNAALDALRYLART
jgi:phytoene dehydrogenase-like protein